MLKIMKIIGYILDSSKKGGIVNNVGSKKLPEKRRG
jgi:hypothetical protein